MRFVLLIVVSLVIGLTVSSVVSVRAQDGIQIASQIGGVHLEDNFLVFTFTEITYDVAPIELPGGHVACFVLPIICNIPHSGVNT